MGLEGFEPSSTGPKPAVLSIILQAHVYIILEIFNKGFVSGIYMVYEEVWVIDTVSKSKYKLTFTYENEGDPAPKRVTGYKTNEKGKRQIYSTIRPENIEKGKTFLFSYIDGKDNDSIITSSSISGFQKIK